MKKKAFKIRLIYYPMIFLCFFINFPPNAQSQTPKNDLRSPKDINNINFRHFATAQFGTHIISAGYKINPYLTLKLNKNTNLNIEMESLPMVYYTNLGIPESSFSFKNKLTTTLSFGAKSHSFDKISIFKTKRKFNLGYHYMHYASTDKTSQFSGGISCLVVFDKFLLETTLENDFFAFLNLDEYRTAAYSIDFFFLKKNKLYGVGLENIQWTGTTTGARNLRDGVYDMSGQHGGEYSHGIVALRLHFGKIMVKLGYDSNALRKLFQDNLHKFIKVRTIPKGSKSRDRLYFQISLNTFGWLY